MITEFTAGLSAGSRPAGIAAGPDGNLWFTDGARQPDRADHAAGVITEFSAGLTRAAPVGIAAGPDGNLWFTDQSGAIGRIGTGAAPALQTPASVTGRRAAGKPRGLPGAMGRLGRVHGADRAVSLRWLRVAARRQLDPGQTTSAYTPTAADAGHQLACRATVTYPLPFQLTATATSPAITIQAAPPPPSIPALSALNISPGTFTLRGRRVGGRCEPATRSNRTHHTCTRRVALTSASRSAKARP